MKIGLIDVDGHNFPNLALMKLSAWHKAQGHDVEWQSGFFHYDIVYQAKVFDFTPDHETIIQADQIIKGGTGYNDTNLPSGIESTYPDYSLYGITDTAYGFLTRGCPRACHFCIVSGKEGKTSHQVADLNQFWNGQRYIKLLDPNLLACKERESLLNQLIDSKAVVDFTQGLDIRMTTPEIIDKIQQIKVKQIHFAWDNYEFKTYEKLKAFSEQYKKSLDKVGVYVLTNFNTTIEQDLERLYKLRELGFVPYLMIYDKHKLKRGHQLLRMQRWVNNRIIWKSCERFENYK